MDKGRIEGTYMIASFPTIAKLPAKGIVSGLLKKTLGKKKFRFILVRLWFQCRIILG